MAGDNNKKNRYLCCIFTAYYKYDSQLLLQEHRTYPDVTIEQRFSSTES